jgi:hypothetical protein
VLPLVESNIVTYPILIYNEKVPETGKAARPALLIVPVKVPLLILVAVNVKSPLAELGDV